jgi:hypothetical protein
MLPNCISQEQPPFSYNRDSKMLALEKYSLSAFYYLGSKRRVAALEKYSLAAFYYLGGKREVAALEKYSLHRDSKMLLNYFSRAANPLLPPRW